MPRASFGCRGATALTSAVSWSLMHVAAVGGDVVPLGPEFLVNTYTTYRQGAPAVAADASGGFVVVWQSGYLGLAQDGSDVGIFGQRFDSSGSRLGAEFQVNSYTTGFQEAPVVAADASGGFVVVWDSHNYYFFQDLIFGQRFDSGGARLGTEFQVNTYTSDSQEAPAVAAGASGAFVVVWQSGYGQDRADSGIFGQRFDGDGVQLGTEFQVNTYTTHEQEAPAVAADATGSFVVVWQGYVFSAYSDGPLNDVFGQRFDSSGARLGTEFRVNTYTTRDQQAPAVAADAGGGFVVVWESFPVDEFDSGVFGQRFDSSGARAGTEFQINTYTTGEQETPAIDVDASGGFVVAWHSTGHIEAPPRVDDDVFGQRFDSSGARLGTEFRIDTATASRERVPAVAGDAAGGFVVVWDSFGMGPLGPDGDESGVFARRFAEGTPTTTTTTTVSSTSTTMAPGEACGDPIGDGFASGDTPAVITAADALAVLRASVGLFACELCVCDVDGSGSTTATDALRLLRLSIGATLSLHCPPCAAEPALLHSTHTG